MSAPDGFKELFSWALPLTWLRHTFYPSATVCARVQFSHAFAGRTVRERAVIAVDEDTRVTVTRGRVAITRYPWFSGEGWGLW